MATAMAGAPSSLLTDSVAEGPAKNLVGYRLEVFERKQDREKYSCGFCEKILREPLQAECGHRFCENCKKPIEDSIKAGRMVYCKICKAEGTPDEDSRVNPAEMYPDRGIKREMLSIKTKCPNENCKWEGVFKEYVKHEGDCEHQPVHCDKCGDPVSKLKIELHHKNECTMRVVKCDHCKNQMPQAQKAQHQKECPKVPATCAQCNKSVSRDQMKKHTTQSCPNREVACPLDGCSPPMHLNQFKQHLQKDQPKHLAYLFSVSQDLQASLSSLADAHAGAAAAMPRGGGAGDLAGQPEALNVLKAKIDQLEQQVQLYVRQGAEAGAGGGAPQAAGGAEAGGDSAVDRISGMEFKVNSLEPILSVLHGEMNRCIAAIEALEGQLRTEMANSQQFRQKIEQYEQTIATMSTSLSQREAKMRELETRLSNVSQDKADGTLLWRIPNFSQVRQDAIAGSVSNIHSRPFYTGALGYKMCVRLYPNGDGMGKGTHLSLFFTLMRSNHDALLAWPFKQKVYFMLIDQSFKKHIVDAFRSEPNSSSFQRPTSEMNIATGCPLFMQQTKLSQPGHGYLKDDTMFIRIVVETDGLDEHVKQFDPRTVPLANATA